MKFFAQNKGTVITVGLCITVLSILSVLKHPYLNSLTPIPHEHLTISECSLLKDNICTLYDNTTFKIWINNDLIDSEVIINSNKIIDFEEHEKGKLYTLNTPKGLHFIEVKSPQYQTNFQVKSQSTPAWLQKIITFKDKGELNKLIEALPGIKSRNSDLDLAQYYYYLSRSYLKANEYNKALETLEKSNKLFSKNNYWAQMNSNLSVKSHIHIFLKDQPQEATTLVEKMNLIDYDATSHFFYHFYKSYIHEYSDQLKLALQSAELSSKISHKLQLREKYTQSQFIITKIMVKNGNIENAVKIRESLVNSLETNNCIKMRLLSSLGWAKIQLLEKLKVDQPNTEDILSKANAINEGLCKSKFTSINLMINFSKYHFLKGNISKSIEFFDTIPNDQSALNISQRLEKLELEALISTSFGKHDKAEKAYHTILNFSEQYKFVDLKLNAFLGLAKLYEHNNKTELALKQYKKAEEIIFNHASSITSLTSQSKYISSNINFSHDYITLLLESNQIEESIRAIRKFRSFWLNQLHGINAARKSIASIDPEWVRTLIDINKSRKSLVEIQESSWSLASDELIKAQEKITYYQNKLSQNYEKILNIYSKNSKTGELKELSPQKKELLLYFYPLKNNWVGFAVNKDTIQHHIIQTGKSDFLDVDKLAFEWVNQFSDLIRSADTIKIYPFSRMNEVNFSSIIFGSSTLLHQKNVIYGVDIPQQKNIQATISTSQNTSLILANSKGDLNKTEIEAKSVSNTMTFKNWESKLLVRNQIKYGTVKSELEKVNHFHYAGHVFESETDKKEFSIPLSDNTNININDIIMLKRSPKWVVLSACNSSKNNSIKNVESAGLAHAFIISGSETVIATTKPVADIVANELMQEFYQHWSSNSDFKESFRQAQLTLIHEQPETDWLSFRIVTI